MTYSKPEQQVVLINDIFVDFSVQDPYNEPWIDTLVQSWNPANAKTPILSARPNGQFHCIDGKHGVAARGRLGIESVQAVVLHGLSHEDEARAWLGQNTSKPKSAVQRFRIQGQEAQDEPYASLCKLLDQHHLVLGSSFFAVGKLKMLGTRTNGMAAVDDTLFTATQAWGRTKDAVHQNIVSGLGTLFLRREPDRQVLVTALRKTTPEVFLAKGKAIHRDYDVKAPVAYAELALRMYNGERRGSNRLATLITA